MVRTPAILLAVLLTIQNLPPAKTVAAAAQDESTSPSSEPARLPNGWKWDREVPGHAQMQGDAIQLRTESGRIWAGTGSRNRIMTKEPLGDTGIATATIALVDAVGKYEQCGLLVYQDDDAFVKLVIEHIDGPHFVVMAREVGEKRKVLAKIEIPTSQAELRLQVQGDRVVGLWRFSSQEAWKAAAETELAGPKPRHFAVFSQDADPDQPRYALVRNLRCQ